MMKSLFLISALFLGLTVFSQTDDVQTVEASCGQCNFGLKGSGCSLAVKIDGKAYFVEDANIHDHGDAHGDEGMCNVVRTAEVKGKVEKGKFRAEYFKLLPYEKGGK